MKKKGFTLIELLVVVAIIGVLSSVVLSSLSEARYQSRAARALLEMRQIDNAFNLYLIDNNVSGINIPPPAQHGTTSYQEPDCRGTQDLSPSTGNDFPNSAFIDTFGSEIDSYFDTSSLNPWGYRYEIDASYYCTLSTRGCSTTGWVNAIVTNQNNILNNYSSDDIVYERCIHGS